MMEDSTGCMAVRNEGIKSTPNTPPQAHHGSKGLAYPTAAAGSERDESSPAPSSSRNVL